MVGSSAGNGSTPTAAESAATEIVRHRGLAGLVHTYAAVPACSGLYTAFQVDDGTNTPRADGPELLALERWPSDHVQLALPDGEVAHRHFDPGPYAPVQLRGLRDHVRKREALLLRVAVRHVP